jgi:phosphate butyryltransferase
MIEDDIRGMQTALVKAGCFDADVFQGINGSTCDGAAASRLETALKAEREAQDNLRRMSNYLRERVVEPILSMDKRIENPADYDKLRDLMERILTAVDDFKREPGFVEVFSDLYAVYLFILYRCGAPGRESPIIRLILSNRARRKAVELSRTDFRDRLDRLEKAVSVAIIAKRYSVYVLASKGFGILFRSEIDFRTHGKSPESLALQIANIFLKNGIPLNEITDIVCAGGDLGNLPDGIYVLNEAMRKESWKRLANSSLNRGALVACELRDLLAKQGAGDGRHLSLVSPLSFTTLESHEKGRFFNREAIASDLGSKGYVKVSPLKSIAALLSETQRISPDKLNLVLMTLDELFASVVKKVGPHVKRELGQQRANETLNRFDFKAIVEALEKENFSVPHTFRLASEEVGTGVKEICELLMIIKSGRVSPGLTRDLKSVVQAYADGVASVIESASTGRPEERPNYVAITSMMALDPYFQDLFARIRNRIENPFTPIMCLDSLEHEYLIADNLFELYVNPAQGETRLQYAVEAASMKQALRVLESSGSEEEVLSFQTLREKVTEALSTGDMQPGNLVLVGADNEDALVAVANAREFGLLKKVVLIGDPEEITKAIERSRIPLSPSTDDHIEILPIDRLAVDYDSKKAAMADTFHTFLKNHPNYIIMKGSLSTGPLLKKALAIYKEADGKAGSDAPHKRRLASHTALMILPDKRFFALSDAAVNPSFSGAEDLLRVMENQIEIVRKVTPPAMPLKVAIITAVEKQTAAIPATQLAAQVVELSERLQEAYGPLIVEGPLSFDLATVPDVAEEKHYEGQIKGDANCLIATDINTANVLYKMLSKTMGSLGVMVDAGAIITAGPGTTPIVLTSRGDTAETKFNSILLAFAYCDKGECDVLGLHGGSKNVDRT